MKPSNGIKTSLSVSLENTDNGEEVKIKDTVDALITIEQVRITCTRVQTGKPKETSYMHFSLEDFNAWVQACSSMSDALITGRMD